MSDLISRRSAIDLVRDMCNAIMCECESHYDDEVGDEVYEDVREVDAILKCNKRIRKALRNMPSAQPTQTNTPNALETLDCISRQTAIEALRRAEALTRAFGYHNVIDTIRELPSVQPDRSLWFRIGEICVDESKGFISSGRAVEKIRELLREAERREEHD